MSAHPSPAKPPSMSPPWTRARSMCEVHPQPPIIQQHQRRIARAIRPRGQPDEVDSPRPGPRFPFIAGCTNRDLVKGRAVVLREPLVRGHDPALAVAGQRRHAAAIKHGGIDVSSEPHRRPGHRVYRRNASHKQIMVPWPRPAWDQRHRRTRCGRCRRRRRPTRRRTRTRLRPGRNEAGCRLSSVRRSRRRRLRIRRRGTLLRLLQRRLRGRIRRCRRPIIRRRRLRLRDEGVDNAITKNAASDRRPAATDPGYWSWSWPVLSAFPYIYLRETDGFAEPGCQTDMGVPNGYQSSAFSPSGAIFTSLGSNRATTSTRSRWAPMTCSISL